MSIIVDEKTEYTVSEDGAVIFGAEVLFVAELYDDARDCWRYRFVFPAGTDMEAALDAIRNSGAKFNVNSPEPDLDSDPSEYVYLAPEAIREVVFVEDVDFSSYEAPFELNGYTVIEANGSGNVWSFVYESADAANRAYGAFIESADVVYINRGEAVRDIYNVGDVRADGKLDIYDYIYLKRYVNGDDFGYNGEAMRRNGDINADAAVDLYDVILLRRHLFGTYNIDFIIG